ncbi:hypothetical protein McpSp1_08140 [Methanocorpusculaceae archaeon Sp1]|nr:hypothetical protein [Methanocorpusculaceae archaeon Sp1]
MMNKSYLLLISILIVMGGLAGIGTADAPYSIYLGDPVNPVVGQNVTIPLYISYADHLTGISFYLGNKGFSPNVSVFVNRTLCENTNIYSVRACTFNKDNLPNIAWVSDSSNTYNTNTDDPIAYFDINPAVAFEDITINITVTRVLGDLGSVITDQYTVPSLTFQASPAPTNPIVDIPTFSDITSTSAIAVVNFTSGLSQVTPGNITLTFTGGSSTPTYTVGDIQEVDKSSDKYNATISINGLVTGDTYSVTATVKNNAGLTNTSAAATLTPRTPTGITISGAPSANVTDLADGTLTATITYNDETTGTTGVSWSSDNPDVVSIDTDGNWTAHMSGTAVIIATVDDANVSPLTDIATINVDATPYTVSFSSIASSVVQNSNGTLTATVKDKKGADITANLEWISDPAGNFTFSEQSGNTVTWNATKTGTATITLSATANGVSKESLPTSVTVTRSVTDLTLRDGPATQINDLSFGKFNWTVTYSDGSTADDVTLTWESSDSEILSVDANGNWVAEKAGTDVVITATVPETSVSDETNSITIVATPFTVSFSSIASSVVQNSNGTLTATVKDKKGADITANLEWISDPADNFTFSEQSGNTVTWNATKVGTATITLNATANGVSKESLPTSVTVTRSVTDLTLRDGPATQINDLSFGKFNWTVTYSDGSTADDVTLTWESSDSEILSVDANGNWVAEKAGTDVVITATVPETSVSDETNSITIVATPFTVSFSSIASSVVQNSNGTLTATVKDKKGADITANLEWISDPADNFTFSEQSGNTVTWNATKVGTATITLNATANGVSKESSPTSVTVTRSVTGLTLRDCPASQINDLAFGKFNWTVTYSDGSTADDVTLTWKSSDSETLSVDASGNWVAQKAGTGVVITATVSETSVSDKTNSITIAATPAKIEISPLTLPLKQGDSGSVTAVVRDKHNETIETLVTWGTDNMSVINFDSGTNQWHAVAKGTANITATATSGDVTKQQNYSVTVVNIPKTVEITGNTVLRMGETASFGVILKDIDGEVMTPEIIQWTSKNIDVFTVNSNGLVTPVAPGTANINVTAMALGVTVGNETAITIKPAVGVSIINPIQNNNYHAGTSIDFNASVSGLDNIISYQWDFGEETAATTHPTEQNTTHTYNEFISPGFKTVNFTVTYDGGVSAISRNISINIIKNVSRAVSLTIQTAPSYVYTGREGTLEARVLDQYGDEMKNEIVDWTSSPTGAFVFSGNDWTSEVAGTATITGTVRSNTSVSNTTGTITILAEPVADSVVISGAPAKMSTGSSTQLVAVVLDQNNAVMSGQTFTWTSSGNNIVSVASDGTIKAVAAGTATITATSSSGKTGDVTIEVIDTTPARTPTSITITGSAPTLYEGDTLSLGATVLDGANAVMQGQTITWSSSNPAVATVGPTGIVTTVGEGSTMITATVNSIASAPVTITVLPVTTHPIDPVLTTVTVSPNSAKLYIDDSVQLSAVALDETNSPFQGVTWIWTSSDTAVVETNNGLVTAKASGNAEITAETTIDGVTKSAVTTIIVNEKPVFVDNTIASVSITGGDLTVPQGTTGTLKALVLNAGGILLPDEKVTWASADPTNVTIDSATGVYRANQTGGPVTITATTATSESATIKITVTGNPDLQTPASVKITAPSSMTPGQTATATATVSDQYGKTIAGEIVIWESSNENTVSVSSGGTLTAKALGSATITAKVAGYSITDTLTITVANTPQPYVPTSRPTGGSSSSDSGYSDSTSAGISGTGSASFGSSTGFTGVAFSRGTTGIVILGTGSSNTPTPQNCYLMRDISAPSFQGSAEIEFSVPIALLQDRGLTVNDVILKHYVNGNWVNLPTFFVGEERGAAKYVATTSSFSPFAIVYERGGASTVQKATPQPTASSGTAKTAAPTAAATSAAGQQPGTPNSQTAPVTGTAAAPTAAAPTLTQAPVPVAGLLAGLFTGLLAASLNMRRRE